MARSPGIPWRSDAPPLPRRRVLRDRATIAAASSSVTDKAVGQVACVDPVFADQLLTKRARIARRLPAHVGDELSRPQMRRRIAVTIEAEPHLERYRPHHQWHPVDAAVT